MEVRNESLYRAMKDYVAAAISAVALKTRQEVGFNESYFSRYWPLARQGTDFSEVPHYALCLKLLKDDKAISRHLNQQIGLTPSAEKMMKLILDLGLIKDGYLFDPIYFDNEYRIFEDTFYLDVHVCSALAPIEGLLWDAEPLKLSDSLGISQLKQEDMPWGWIDESIHWNSLWCAVRVQYELPKFHRDVDDQCAHLKRQREIEDQVRDQMDYVVSALRVFGNCFDFYYSAIILEKPRWAE